MKRKALIPTIFDEFDDFFSLDFPVKRESSGVSLYENEGQVIAEAHIPGTSPEDVHVNFEKGILFVKAETKEEKDDKKYHMKASSSFSYRIPLPNNVDESASPEAICKNGVLKVMFPKKQGDQSRKIEVQFQ